LLKVGNGDIGHSIPTAIHAKEIVSEDMMGMNFPYTQEPTYNPSDEQLLEAKERFLNVVFPDDMLSNPDDYEENQVALRTILTIKNEQALEWNELALTKLPGVTQTFFSTNSINADSTRLDEDERRGRVYRELLTDEYLQSRVVSGLPAHELKLKVGAIIMILRNINPSLQVVNGTKCVLTGFYNTYLKAIKLDNKGRREQRLNEHGEMEYVEINIPRITMTFHMGKEPCRIAVTRKQYPVALTSAMTTNKSQGQTLKFVGVDLREKPFAHGQTFVALSRVQNRESLAFYGREKRIAIQNVVMKELLDFHI